MSEQASAKKSASAEVVRLRRFYVYVLKNEAGEVFYVGRGTGGRMMQHMARSHNEGVNGRLSEAVAGDARVTAEVRSWHATADEAAGEEKRVIKSFPDGMLVNLVHTRAKRPGGHKGGRKPGVKLSEKVLIRIGSELLVQVDKAAKKVKSPRAAFIRNVLDRFLDDPSSRREEQP